MRLIVDIQTGPGGRPTGTVQTPQETAARANSGNLEFPGLIERFAGPSWSRLTANNPLEES
jgi:hypothetical protein